MPVRLRDVAELAGVSMTTASIVLRRQPGARVSSGTRERVRQAADRLGYLPRDVTPSPRLIGVVFEGGLGEVGVAFMAALVEAARLRECVVVVLPGGEYEAGKAHVSSVGDLPLHGIVGVGASGRYVAAPAHLADRTVLVDLWPGPEAESVEGRTALIVPDDLQFAMDLAHHLGRRGHRRVAIVAPDQGARGVAGRWRRGLLRVLGSGADVQVVPAEARHLAADDVHQVVRQSAGGTPVIVCMGGRCAETVLAELSGTGAAVPGALEIVVRSAPGDDIAPDPRVVRIPAPVTDLARAAVGRLLDPVVASDSRSRRVYVPFALNVSTLEPDVLSPVG